MSRVSASRAALLHACRWWARADAPRVEAEPGDSAKDGTALHALVDANLRGVLDQERARRIAATGADPFRVDRLWGHALPWLTAHTSPWMRSEVVFAWDPATDRGYELTETLEQLGLHGPRPYADPDAWARIRAALGLSERAIPGTADLVTIVDGVVVIYDWCTGRTDKREQLRLLALMIARAMDLEEVRIVTLRLSDEGLGEDDHGTLDTIDLASLAGEYAALTEQVEGSEPEPGAHCAGLYCPAFLACPTTQGAISELIPAQMLTAGASAESDRRASYRMSMEIQGVEHAAWLLPRVNLLRDAAEALRDALKGWASEHEGIPSAPGMTWGPVQAMRSNFLREKAEALIRLLGGTDEQIASCVNSAAVTSFRDTKNKRSKGRAA